MIVMAAWAWLAQGQTCVPDTVTLPSTAPVDVACTRRTAVPPAATADGIALVTSSWLKAFGTPLEADRVGWTDAGYVSMPFERYLTVEERAAEQVREHMVTDVQREKATSALGPERHGSQVYTHFLGADARFTDFWGRPETIAAVLTLAAGWHEHCVSELGASAKNCTLQIGDIAYFGPVQPDPLGHYDHYDGRCTDLRLFRNDGSRYEAWYNKPDDRDGVTGGYDPVLTKAFLEYAMAHTTTGDVFYSDPAVHEAIDGVEPRKRHDDHMHLCFAAGS